MSDSQKRPGVRDISDLKARLGLKKGGPAAKKNAPGVVPPPGVRMRGGLPAPPGAEPPGPKVSDDPFGAMNAMAAQQAVHRAPEVIVVETGGDVESVEHSSKALTYLKYVAAVLVPLVLGVAIGQMASGAKQFNQTVDDSAAIEANVKKIRKSLVGLQYAFLEAKKRGIKPNDPELKAALDKVKIAYEDADEKIVFGSNMYDMEEGLVGDILYFYREVGELKRDLGKHKSLTNKETKYGAVHVKNLEDAAKRLKKAEPAETENQERYSAYRFAVLGVIPTEQEAGDPSSRKKMGMQVVEIGQPICQNGQASATLECPGQPKGFKYRTGASAAWQSGDLDAPAPGSSNFAAGKLILIQPNLTFNGLIKGNDPSVAEATYIERLRELITKTDELIDLGIALEKTLKSEAGKGKQFTFFL